MQLYFIYCLKSSEDNLLAGNIEAAAGAGLKAISIKSEQANELLDQAFIKGWKYRPYLVIVTHNRVSASTGYEMFLNLKILLGPQKGWQVYSLGQQYGVKLTPRVRQFAPKRSFSQ